uniref:Uncharacterized protein n=1 Tax=Arundo donax TaxID=35708 RepID=A0A0A9GGI5_ARUDO
MPIVPSTSYPFSFLQLSPMPLCISCTNPPPSIPLPA